MSTGIKIPPHAWKETYHYTSAKANTLLILMSAKASTPIHDHEHENKHISA